MHFPLCPRNLNTANLTSSSVVILICYVLARSRIFVIEPSLQKTPGHQLQCHRLVVSLNISWITCVVYVFVTSQSTEEAVFTNERLIWTSTNLATRGRSPILYGYMHVKLALAFYVGAVFQCVHRFRMSLFVLWWFATIRSIWIHSNPIYLIPCYFENLK